MKRRTFLGGLAFATVAGGPFSVAVQARKVPQVGLLMLPQEDAFWAGFQAAMRDRGYIDGETVAYERRTGSGNRLEELAAELAQIQVDVIVARQTPAAHAARNATPSIPIVASAGDLIGAGLVASLGQPGGNVTGVTAATGEVAAKCVELTREALPSLRRIGLLANQTDPFTRSFLNHTLGAAKLFGIQARAFMVTGPGELDRAFADIDADPVDALLVQPSLPRRQAFDLAVARKLPAVAPIRDAAASSALMTYSADAEEVYRSVALYVHRILNGAEPSTLPVSQPTKFHLSVNLKTAKALGIELPFSVLVRADEVIE